MLYYYYHSYCDCYSISVQINGILNNFSSHLQDEFACYEANDPFSQTLMVQVDGLLGSFLPLLTEENYKSLVSVLVAEVAAQLEKAIMKSTFNRVCFASLYYSLSGL